MSHTQAPASQSPVTRALSTRVLMVCAAVGVATGIVGGIEGWLVTPVVTVAPIAYGLILGVHVLPGIIAQELFRLPLVALLTHVLAALVSSAVAPPFMPQFLMTAVLFGGIQEGIAAIFRYRAWGWWRFTISALVIGTFIATVLSMAADIGSLTRPAQIAYVALSFAGPVGWTFAGLGIGAALRRAGIGAPQRTRGRRTTT